MRCHDSPSYFEKRRSHSEQDSGLSVGGVVSGGEAADASELPGAAEGVPLGMTACR